MIAEKMTQGFSQVVYVENRPGASSDFGTGLLAKSPPDGYNLGVNKTTSNPNVVENDLFIATSPLDPPGFPRQWFDYKQVQKHLHGPGSVQARLPPARPP